MKFVIEEEDQDQRKLDKESLNIIQDVIEDMVIIKIAKGLKFM